MSVPGAGEQVRVEPDIRRVLVYRLGSLGDTLVALPSLHLIAKAFPNAERRMLTNVPVASKAAAAAAVLGDSGLIHSYERYPLRLRSIRSLFGLVMRLRRFRPEVIVYLKATTHLETARRDAWFLKLVGASRVVGLPLTVEYQKPLVLADGSAEPEASRLLRTMHPLGNLSLDEPGSWDLRLTPKELKAADDAMIAVRDIPFFAVSVGTKVQAKDWGGRNWRSLLESLARDHPGFGLVLAGAAEESELSEFAAEGWRGVLEAGPVVNLCGKMSPRESAASFGNAIAFIGHDSGPMHLAAVVGTPTVAIFSSRNKPRTWFPVCRYHSVLYHRVDCWGCGLETCVEQKKKCILSITVQEVMQGLKQLLQESEEARSRIAEAGHAA